MFNLKLCLLQIVLHTLWFETFYLNGWDFAPCTTHVKLGLAQITHKDFMHLLTVEFVLMLSRHVYYQYVCSNVTVWDNFFRNGSIYMVSLQYVFFYDWWAVFSVGTLFHIPLHHIHMETLQCGWARVHHVCTLHQMVSSNSCRESPCPEW